MGQSQLSHTMISQPMVLSLDYFYLFPFSFQTAESDQRLRIFFFFFLIPLFSRIPDVPQLWVFYSRFSYGFVLTCQFWCNFLLGSTFEPCFDQFYPCFFSCCPYQMPFVSTSISLIGQSNTYAGNKELIEERSKLNSKA